jgi:spore coat polysaccharide biosynthesis protein SpsF (cytidylyltransferase family)
MPLSNHTGIIIQARTGSTRLPGKMILPFHENQNLISLMINKFKRNAGNVPFVIATTVSSGDDLISEICEKSGVRCFRGSENNVLDRFIKTAEKYSFETIIRVCADNPFFDVAATLLLGELLNESKADYAGFEMDGNQPSIKTHIGLWGEAVTLKALQKAASLTSESLYQEHVTNYIYGHPQTFKIRLISAPSELKKRTDLRFTLDTPEDYELHRKIYKTLAADGKSDDINALVNFVDQHNDFKQVMKNQIIQNTK